MLTEVRPRQPRARVLRPLAVVLPVALVVWGFVCAYLIQLALDRAGEGQMREKAVAELAYFPSGRFVRQAAIEYQGLAADLVWLRAIQYYGYHLMTDRKYEWLGHVFAILTSLDPAFIAAYHFGAITLAWDARKPHEAIDFLMQGMKSNQLNWQIPFDAGFIYYIVLRDYDRASTFFEVASKMPNSWFILARWAAIAKAKAGDFRTAREMWLDILKGTQNRALKALVVRQMKHLAIEETLDRLQKAVQQFEEDRRRPPRDLSELVGEGYVEDIPEEPFGGQYVLKRGRVVSTTPPAKRE